MKVGPVGAHRSAGDGGPEAISERVLDAGPDTDVGLDAGDDDPLRPLLLEEQRQVGGEERREAALVNYDLTRPLLESGVRLLIAVTEIAVFGELGPLVIEQALAVGFARVDDQPLPVARRLQQLVQRAEVVERTGIVERTLGVEERPVDIDQEQGEAMAG